jgi:uncharacterized MAPEG superfamily protein
LTNSVAALFLYGAWTLLLLIGITSMRARLIVTGKRKANSFCPTGEDAGPFSVRLCRAHANAYENLPIFAAVVASAVLSGRSDITDGTALIAVAARVAQSSTHLVSTSDFAVHVRFYFLLAQMLLIGWWSIRLTLVWLGM